MAEETGALVALPEFTVPAVFQEPNDKIVGQFRTPYIVFCHPNRADEWQKLLTQFGGAIQEGDMFLVQDGVYTKLPTAKLAFIKAKQFWARKNAAGEILETSWSEMPFPWDEIIEAVVAVYLDDKMVIANIQPRTTKCSGFKVLADALDECQTPDWGKKSPAHAATLAIPTPMMRFFGELTVASPRTSKKSGKPYRTTSCTIKPVTNVEVPLLRDFFMSEEGVKALADAAQRYQTRIQDVEAKLLKR